MFFFFNFCPNCTNTRDFSRHIFPAHFVTFLFLVFVSFSFIFSTPSWKWRPTLFVLDLGHLCLWSSGYSVKKKLSNYWRSLNDDQAKWSKVKTLEDKPRSGCRFLNKLLGRYYQKSCKYMRNNSSKQKGKKKFNFTLSIKVSGTTVRG